MGRRAIPKIDPAIDVSHHLFPLDDLSPPFDADTFFDFAQPLVIEVGSGKGMFLLDASGHQPDQNYLGIEIAKKYARLAAYRLAKNDRRNARIICGDAMRFFHEFLARETTREIHVYFPDPWWKERHRRRRVINPDFVGDAERVLVSGGTLHFWTDVEEYYESATEIITDHTNLAGPESVNATEAAHDMDYRTHFERRMRKGDHPVFRCQFRKR